MKKTKLLTTSIVLALAGVGAASCLAGCGGNDNPQQSEVAFRFSIGLKSGKNEFRVGQTDQILIYDNGGKDSANRTYKYYSSNPEAASVDENTGVVTFNKPATNVSFYVKEDKVSNPAQLVKPVNIIAAEVNNADGGFNFANASGDAALAKRTEILGKLEKYTMDSHLTGITLFDNGGLVRYSERVNLPTQGQYVTGYGFGLLTEGSLDPNKPLTGTDGQKNPDYLHSSIAQDSMKINQYTATGSQISDLASYITSTYWGTKLKGLGYEWAPVLATDEVYPVTVDASGAVKVDTSAKKIPNTAPIPMEPLKEDLPMYKKWRIYVKTDGDVNGSVLKFHQYYGFDENGKPLPYLPKDGGHDGVPVKIEDYIFPYKMLLTGSNAVIRGTEMANDSSYGIKGAARYFSDTKSELKIDKINEAWDKAVDGNKLGIHYGEDANGAYIDLELINAIDSFTAMYTLSSSLVSPLPQDMFIGPKAVVPNDFKKSASYYGTFNNGNDNDILKYTVSCGAFTLTKWEKEQQLVFARNDDWFEYKKPDGTITGRYNIPGIYYRVIDVSQNPEKTWDQFELGNLDSVGVPIKKVSEWKGKPGIYETEGDSTFKLNVNSCTQEQWNEKFGPNGSISPNSVWEVKPWMSNSNFLDGLFYSIDRKQFADKRGVKPSINYFSDSYMADPQKGISYNSTQAHKDAVKGYETYDENGVSDFGYDYDKALSCFRNAVKQLSDANKIALGTKDKPTEIHIHIRWMYQTDIKEYGEDIKYYFEKAFNDESVCGGKVKLVVDQDAVQNWEDVYNKWMMKGQFDLGFGAISGNTFNPLNFMEVLKSDNSSNFTLNWGADTGKIDPLHPIVYDDGTGAKEWSFDGLWEVADHGGILSKGVKVDPVKSTRVDADCFTRGGKVIEEGDLYSGAFDLALPIEFVKFESGDSDIFDIERLDTYIVGKGNVTLGEKSEDTLTYDKANKKIIVHVDDELAKDINDQIIQAQRFTPEQIEKDPAKGIPFNTGKYGVYYEFEIYYSIKIGDTLSENFVTVSM